VFHISIWGSLEFVWGGLSPTKPPRGDGTATTFPIQRSLIYKEPKSGCKALGVKYILGGHDFCVY